MSPDQDKSQLFVQKNDPKGGKLSREKLPLPKVVWQNACEEYGAPKACPLFGTLICKYCKYFFGSLES